jgi:hypothetical protein
MRSFPRRTFWFLVGLVTVGSLLACTCSGTNCGRTAAKVVPYVKKVDPVYGTEPVDCDPPTKTASPQGCIIDTLTCGDEIEGNNSGGRNLYGDDFYNEKFCSPQRHNWDDSPEAIYGLIIPPNVEASVTLVSDCGDLDIASLSWTDFSRCPNSNHPINQCEMNESKPEGGTLKITTVDRKEQHLLVVDGKKGTVGNFRLLVKCTTYR